MVKSTNTVMKLDAEDKEWLGDLFKQMDDRFAQIDDRFAQIDDRFAQIDDRFAQIDDRFSRMEELFDLKLERMETRLLTEFHKWASPVDARLRTHSAAFRAIELEIEALSDRVAKLESSRPN
jgi:chromosome segregation ATPase